MREMAKEEAERLYASQMQLSITHAVEEALSDMYQPCFESLKEDLRHSSYVFMQLVLTKWAHNEVIYAMFDQSAEPWTQ